MGSGSGPSENKAAEQRALGINKQVALIALLVARAGQKDSLGWWDDESLTDAGRFALTKIFPRNPGRAAVRLAFESARGRHAGVLAAAGVTQATTLLDLAEASIEDIASASNPWSAHIANLDEFRRQLLVLAPDAGTLTLPTPDLAGLLDLTACDTQTEAQEATTLAAGYLFGQKGKPVFPFMRASEGRAKSK